ncbi:Serine incorporator 3, partial [Ascosphaera atra]
AAFCEDATRREMRAEALRAAVESGALPASALDEDSDDEEAGEVSGKDDERASTKYNYSLFHVIFLGATMWVASLLTQNLDPEASGEGLAPVGRTYWASWVKIISAWVCYVLYLWTLVAPVVMPERFGDY